MIGAARSASVSTVYNNSRISDSCLQSRGWACIDFAPGITGTMCVLCARVIQSSAPKTNIYITFLQSCSRPSIAPTHARSYVHRTTAIESAQCTCPLQETRARRPAAPPRRRPYTPLCASQRERPATTSRSCTAYTRTASRAKKRPHVSRLRETEK